MAPSLLGADLLHEVDVAELLRFRIVGVEEVHGIEPAGRAVIVGEDLEPVVHAPQDQLGGEHVGHRAVLEGDVELAVVLDVLVVRAEKAAIAVAGQARDLVHAGRHRGRPDGAPAVRATLHHLQVEAGGEGMAALAHERAAARVAPDAVDGRVRAAVRLASEHPEDLRARLLDDLALLLDGGGVDPVLRVGEDDALAPGRLHHAVGARQRVPEEGGGVAGRPKGARERLLDEDVLARRDRLESDRLVGGGRRAHIDDIDVREHGGEMGVGLGTGLGREGLASLLRGRGHAGQPHIDAVRAAIGEQMQMGGEARAHDADPKRAHGRPILRRRATAGHNESAA